MVFGRLSSSIISSSSSSSSSSANKKELWLPLILLFDSGAGSNVRVMKILGGAGVDKVGESLKSFDSRDVRS